ncbi:unnamed protein product [Somion occarium]|uniref:CCHC-type domain-containing protein n=1 Tax=Somion occarium TaxID=3059160 RepID=A0ABP1DE25_9APHY
MCCIAFTFTHPDAAHMYSQPFDRNTTGLIDTHAQQRPDSESDMSRATIDMSNSAPQCCHCGYRGAHAPNCPFR